MGRKKGVAWLVQPGWIEEIVAADGNQTLISVIEEQCADCRQRLQICGFLNPPCEGLAARI